MATDNEAQASDPDSTDTSDVALLEEALQDALDARANGVLAAPFGVDTVALARARRRAALNDARRQRHMEGPRPDSA